MGLKITVPQGETLLLQGDIEVDTIEVFGTLQIGTPDTPAEDVTVSFVSGPIDTSVDPTLVSRGLICHGTCKIYGKPLKTHLKVSVDPMVGDTSVILSEIPVGWKVGDRFVVAGTNYDGWKRDLGTPRYHHTPEDEVRVVTDIVGSQVFFSEPLIHNHDTPRSDLKTSVANYSRSVTFRSPEGIPVNERAHTMFMGETDIQYTAFENMGRTDKSYQARSVEDYDEVYSDTNIKSRYPLHLHRGNFTSTLIGNSIWDSPGWGIVQHDTNAVLKWNTTYNTYGAGIVSESGNELGIWEDNITIFSKGRSWSDPKDANNEGDPYFDLGHSGDGFWLQGRLIEVRRNIASSVNTGFVYFHRGPVGEGFKLAFDAKDWYFPWALGNDPETEPNHPSIRVFEDNEVFASRGGVQVSKGSPRQRHDVHTIMLNFLAWNVIVGADVRYTSHYTLKDFDVIGRVPTDKYNEPEFGIRIGVSSFDMNIVEPKIHNFKVGVKGARELRGVMEGQPLNYKIVLPVITNTNTYHKYTAINYDGVLPEEVQNWMLDTKLKLCTLKRPVFSFKSGENNVEPYGAKIDTLGVIEWPTAPDTLGWDVWSVLRWLESSEGGYWTKNGENVMLLPIYASDRGTGEVFSGTLEVLLDPSVNVSSYVYQGEV